MAEWPSGRVGEWLNGSVAERPNGRVAKQPSGRVAEWQPDEATRLRVKRWISIRRTCVIGWLDRGFQTGMIRVSGYAEDRKPRTQKTRIIAAGVALGCWR